VAQRCEDQDVLLSGVPFRRWTEERTVQEILAASERGRGGWVLNPNVDVLRMLARDPALGALVAPASLVLADGMPLVWASRLQRCPLPERVAGSSLIWTLPEAAAEHGRSIYLLGGESGVAAQAGQVLVDRFPKLTVAGAYSPPFGAESTAAGLAEIRQRLVAARPDIVFCAFGFPKQERLIVQLRGDLPGAWFVSCGAAVAFVAGAVPRAPHWMQTSGLEWVYRLAREPRRLFRRYAADIPFALRLLADASRTGRSTTASG
jgi:N-acetylglucosaminyldiphosphoundecaprenol N-acetyl-beta-D-mannosaminyltransferase